MKIAQLIIRLLLIGSTLNWLSAGCSRDNAMNPLAGCRIQHTASTYHSSGTDGTIQTDYTYDAQGNLVNRARINESIIPNVGSDKTTNSDTFEYDAANFLTRSTTDVHQQYAFLGKPSEYHLVSTKLYSYANERLSGYTQTDVVFNSSITSGPQQRTITTATAYIYDASGQVIKLTDDHGGSTTYQNEKVVAFPSGYLFEVQDGLVIKATFPGTDGSGAARTLVQLKQYDAQQRLVKHEEFINDSLSMYYTQEWQSAQPAEATLPAFKGHPHLQSPFGEPGVLANYRAYSVNAKHQVVQYSEQHFENQLNAAGYVTSTNQSSQILTNGAQQPDLTTIGYTYTGCN